MKGWWNAEDHTTGVVGTVGNGYDGVRRARPAGVGGTLPRIVLADSVDSVEVVRVVGSGLLNAPSRVGDMVEAGSSLMGDTRRGPRVTVEVWGWVILALAFCCFWMALSCKSRRRSISNSSGEDLPVSTSSSVGLLGGTGVEWPSSALSVMSESVESSCRRRACESGSVCGDGLLAGRRCSGGRVDEVEVAVCWVVVFVDSAVGVDFGDAVAA